MKKTGFRSKWFWVTLTPPLLLFVLSLVLLVADYFAPRNTLSYSPQNFAERFINSFYITEAPSFSLQFNSFISYFCVTLFDLVFFYICPITVLAAIALLLLKKLQPLSAFVAVVLNTVVPTLLLGVLGALHS